MQHPLRRINYLVAAVLLCLVLVGAGAAPTYAATDTRPELRIGLPDEGDTLDPAHFSLTNSFSIATNIYSGLVRYKPGTLDLMPDLALDWDISADGKKYTFYLRDDVVWQKGYGKLTADDVVTSYERVLDPSTGSRWIAELSDVAAVYAEDDYTVVFELHEANAAFLHFVAAFRQGMITNAEAVAELGDDYGRFPVGSGAFEIESWIPGTEVVLKANDDFYLGKPAVSRVRYIIIPDESVRMFALQRGEIDVAINLTNPEMRNMLAADPNIELGEIVSPTIHGVDLNTTLPPLDDVRVRQALYHAIDREGIAQFVLGGMASPAYSPLAPPYLGHTDDVPHYEYDPARARELLAEAGYPNGFDLTFVWNATTNPEILLTLQSGWEDIGVRVHVESVDGGTWIRKLGEGTAPAIFKMTTRPDPHVFFTQAYYSGSLSPGLNFSHYTEIDDLIDAGVKEMDQEKRAEIYAQIQRKMMTDLPLLPVYWPKHTHPYRSYVKGWDGRQQYDAWAFPISIEK